MKILIIEDDELKLEKLTEHLDTSTVKNDFVVKKSLKSGLREACLNNFDVIILDMSLPTFEISRSENGGRFNTFGGQEILQELKRREIDIKAIIFTQFESFGEHRIEISLENLKTKLEKDFKNSYIGTVFYSASDTSWQKNLDNFLATIKPSEKNDD